MAPVDFVYVGLLAWAAWSGYRRGLWGGLAGVFSLVLGVWAGLHLAGRVCVTFGWQSDHVIVKAFAFLCVFLVTVLLLRLVTALLKTAVNVSVGWIDGMLGSLFSLLVWATLMGVGLDMLAGTVDIGDSLISPVLQDLGNVIVSWLQDEKLYPET